MRNVNEAEKVAKFNALRESARARNLPFTMTIKKIGILLGTETCYYSGVHFEGNGQNTRTFDRVDSELGYTDDNVVVCTHAINQAKSNLSLKDLEKLVINMKKFICKKYNITQIKKTKKKKIEKVNTVVRSISEQKVKNFS